MNGKEELSTLDKAKESKDLIKKIGQNITDWRNVTMPAQYLDQRDEAARTMNLKLKDLDKQLKANPNEQEIDQIHKQLVDLNQKTNKAKLLTDAVNLTSDLDEANIDPKAVVKTGVDAIAIAGNLATSLAFDKDKSGSETLYGFGLACFHGLVGMCEGALKGYEEGHGFFDTAVKMVAGIFEKGISGYSKSLATSLLGEKERGQKIIEDLEASHTKELNDPGTGPMKEARKAIILEEQKYLNDLKSKFEKGEDLSNTVRSLELLQLSNKGTSVQSSCLSFLMSNENLKRETIEKIGKDTVNITKSVNDILDDPSRSMPKKLWDMTKDYIDAGLHGVKSFVNGLGKGDALVSGFSGFMSKFSENLEKTAKKKSDTEIELQPVLSFPKSTTDHMKQVDSTMAKFPMDIPKAAPEGDIAANQQQTEYKK